MRVHGSTILTSDGIRAKSGGLTLTVGDYVMLYGDVVVEKISPDVARNAFQNLSQNDIIQE